jgi:hypothetical protein
MLTIMQSDMKIKTSGSEVISGGGRHSLKYGRTDTQPERENGDLISLLLHFLKVG